MGPKRVGQFPGHLRLSGWDTPALFPGSNTHTHTLSSSHTYTYARTHIHIVLMVHTYTHTQAYTISWFKHMHRHTHIYTVLIACAHTHTHTHTHAHTVLIAPSHCLRRLEWDWKEAILVCRSLSKPLQPATSHPPNMQPLLGGDQRENCKC